MSTEVKKVEHTQEPMTLHIGQDGGMFARAGKNKRLIAGFQTATLNEAMPVGEGEANAHLFIAAPDMLAALDVMTRLCEAVAKVDSVEPLPGCNGRTFTENIRQSRAIIAKATGGAA